MTDKGRAHRQEATGCSQAEPEEVSTLRASPPCADDFKTVYDNRPASPTRDQEVEVDVVGKRCVYVNCHRIAGGKPYVSENLPSHTLKTKLGDVLDAFNEETILAALAEAKAVREYFAAYHAAKARGES